MLTQAKRDAVYATLLAYNDSSLETDDAISAVEGIFSPDNLMGLRDWFAMTALQGILSNGMTDINHATDPRSNAITAYIYADAMLEARKRNG